MPTAKGSCQCGAIQFEIEGEPKWIAHCHCADCRRATGAAVSTYVGVEKANARFVAGTPRANSSSVGVRRQFCDTCGSPISYEGERWPTEIHFFVGVFDRPEDFAPKGHAFIEEKLPWLHIVDEGGGKNTD
jgi:hypothetical protein